MRIESITLRELHLPLKHFFETSFGEDRSSPHRSRFRKLKLTEFRAGLNPLLAKIRTTATKLPRNLVARSQQASLVPMLRDRDSRLCVGSVGFARHAFAATTWPKPRSKPLSGTPKPS